MLRYWGYETNTVYIGAIRLNVSTHEFLWVLGISGGVFNLAFLILVFLVHPQPQKRRKLLLQTIGLILLGEAILYILKQSFELFLASTVTFQSLSLAQWLPIIYLLFLTLKDEISSSSSVVKTLPGILTGTIGLVFGLTWCVSIPLMYIYCLQGLIYGFFTYLVLPLVQQFIEQLRKNTTNIFLPNKLYPYDNESNERSDNTERIYRSSRELPLVQTFRFVHEPLGANVTNRFVGRQDEIEYLANRIQLSTGGAFLITGYRGVGKTSFVKQAIQQVREQLSADGIRVIDVWLNLARPMKPTELMHHIVRGFYDRMQELDILTQVTKEFHDDLVLAYQRTSYTIARERSDVREQSMGSESSFAPEFLKFGISASHKRSLAQKQKFTLLGYDDKAAEHDVMRMFNRIQNNTNTLRTPSALDRYLGFNHNSRNLKIIVILDELDKLEDFEDEGSSVIDDMLSSLKNVFTTSGVVFLFVAGRSMQERWIEEVGQGDSLYESIFASNLYLPCIWEETQDVLSRLIVFPERQQDELYQGFEAYLRYHGRGIPRRIVRELNHHVAVNNNASYLSFDDIDLKRLEFYAQLQNILDVNRVFDWNITLRRYRKTRSLLSSRNSPDKTRTFVRHRIAPCLVTTLVWIEDSNKS